MRDAGRGGARVVPHLITLDRRTPDADRWTLPAYARYADEVVPARLADVVVRADDPRHPAVIEDR